MKVVGSHGCQYLAAYPLNDPMDNVQDMFCPPKKQWKIENHQPKSTVYCKT